MCMYVCVYNIGERKNSIDVSQFDYTSAMHNIIASERRGARDEICAHCEITITRI